MITLYHAPYTRSLRPRWLLEELGLTYRLVELDMSHGEHQGEDYRAIHPLGTVPALIDGEQRFLESAAMCLHLADRRHDTPLAPPVNRCDAST